MPTSTTTALANVLQQAYAPGFAAAVYRNNEFLGLNINGQPVFPMSPGTDTAYRWRLNSEGNANVAVMSEGGAAPEVDSQSWIAPSVSPTKCGGSMRITGEVRDALRLGGNPAGMDTLDAEFQLLASDLRDLLNTSLMGASNSGLEVAIDATTTYAGQARGSLSAFESTETNLAGALTVLALRNLHEKIRDNSKGGKPGLILGPHNQVTNYIALAGEPAAANAAYRVSFGTPGAGLDYAPTLNSVTFMGAPFVGVGDFTDTVICFLDLRPDAWHLKVWRDFEVKPQAPAGDDDVYLCTTRAALICKYPALQGKLTGVTA